MDHTALLIIDIQNDYFQGGKMELDKADEAAQKAAALLDHFRKENAPVFHIQHESLGENAGFFIPGTQGQKINERVTPLENETLLIKNFPNGFIQTDLENLLKAQKIQRLVVTGMMTFMCVDATCRAAKDMGFHCTLIHDATAARELTFGDDKVTATQVKTAFLAALSMICDRIMGCEEFLNPGMDY